MLRQSRLYRPSLTRTWGLLGSSTSTSTSHNTSTRRHFSCLLNAQRSRLVLPHTSIRHCSSYEDAEMNSKHLEASHERIFENNRQWVKDMKEADAEFFVKLGEGQSPEYLYVHDPDA